MGIKTLKNPGNLMRHDMKTYKGIFYAKHGPNKIVLFKASDYTAAVHYMENIKSDLFGIVNNRKVYTGHWEIQEPTCEDLVKDFLIDLVNNWQQEEIDFDSAAKELIEIVQINIKIDTSKNVYKYPQFCVGYLDELVDDYKMGEKEAQTLRTEVIYK